jgi:CheY-like chemotaxis protein
MEKYKSVLLIDDDPVTNFLNHTIVTNLNIADEIHIRCNGKKALEFIEEYYLLNKSLPELILLDINMPIMDGFEFLEQFENQPYKNKEKTLVIVISNLFTKNEIDILNQLEYPKYLYKPLKKKELMNILKQESLLHMEEFNLILESHVRKMKKGI